MADLGAVKIVELLTSFAGVGTSSPYRMPRGPATFQATVVTTSTGANAVIQGSVVVQVSNDTTGWLGLGTCSATGSASATDGFAAVVPWAYSRMVVTTLTTGVAALLTGRIGV